MTEWSKNDFDVAATQLAFCLCKEGDGGTAWSYEKECLAVVSKHEPKQIYDHDTQPLNDALCDGDTIVLQGLCTVDWFISISYSHIWRVPVVHFTVQTQEGTPLSRQQVMSYLHSYSTDIDNTNANLEFVSIDEHPVTGLPAYFFHPCQTPRLLELLRASATSPTLRLWSWMSMMLPRVGISIRPVTFCQIQVELEENDAKGRTINNF